MAWEPSLLYILRNITYHMKGRIPSDDILKCCHLEHVFAVWHSPLFMLHFQSMDSVFFNWLYIAKWTSSWRITKCWEKRRQNRLWPSLRYRSSIARNKTQLKTRFVCNTRVQLWPNKTFTLQSALEFTAHHSKRFICECIEPCRVKLAIFIEPCDVFMCTVPTNITFLFMNFNRHDHNTPPRLYICHV